LRGISFHGANLGLDAINVTQVGNLYIEHCSIAEFRFNGVDMGNGGNLFVTDTDMRACLSAGILSGSGATPSNLVAHDSRFTECNLGVSLFPTGTSDSTGSLVNCTASLCGLGFQVFGEGASNGVLTLTNCRATGNRIGIHAETTSTGGAFIFMANCVVTRNTSGIVSDSFGGTAAVFGTNPATNLIASNGTNGSVSTVVILQ
jgi:hypothetical protein